MGREVAHLADFPGSTLDVVSRQRDDHSSKVPLKARHMLERAISGGCAESIHLSQYKKTPTRQRIVTHVLPGTVAGSRLRA
jgi:hypothetical protein